MVPLTSPGTPVVCKDRRRTSKLPNSLRTLPGEDAVRMRKGIIEGLASVVPNVAQMQNADLMSAELAGGVIFAWGETDIDDVASGLHQRSAIGPR